MQNYVMVLNDGSTYTDLAGCKIIEVDDDNSAEVIETLIEHYAGCVVFDVMNGKPHLIVATTISVEGI